ncbi:MAG: hypothetical protein ACT4PG_05620 [Panacagrimonas sp.]
MAKPLLSTRAERAKTSRQERKLAADAPLDVDLTVSFRFGEEARDKVTVIDNRRVPMVGSVFESRDLVVRNFVRLLLKAGVSQPKVLAELLPALKFLRKS